MLLPAPDPTEPLSDGRAPGLGEPGIPDSPSPGSGSPVASFSSLVEAAATGATLRSLASTAPGAGPVAIAPLPSTRAAEPFERLRDGSDAHLARTGERPAVFLATLGPIAAFTGRATFARNFFEAGGIAAILGDGYADLDAMIEAYRDFRRQTRVPVLVRRDLPAAGASRRVAPPTGWMPNPLLRRSARRTGIGAEGCGSRHVHFRRLRYGGDPVRRAQGRDRLTRHGKGTGSAAWSKRTRAGTLEG